ncbi:MAG: hypothetical protein LBT11_07440 [Treponema sp.]|jgi:tetratricopeptide (TPR) repeat protein|nr:hypothetical protein [Treponema sp.]
MALTFRRAAAIIVITNLFACGGLFAQQTALPWWYTLEEGKELFRQGSYGEALVAFERARDQRMAMYTRMEQDMITLLSLPELRIYGDALDLVEGYIASNGRPSAAAALEELYYRAPRSSMANSVRQALAWFGRLKNYPEAEYWIGETYRMEGELGIALRQYQRALDNRDLLERPGFDLEILYKTAGLRRVRQEYAEMEKTLLEILEGTGPDGLPRGGLWVGSNDPFIRNAMVRTLANDGIDRFLNLYRYNNTQVLKAHQLLGLYYYAAGRYDEAAEHLMFALLIQSSVVIDEVLRSEFDFSYSSLGALFDALARRPLLRDWLEENAYYKTLYYLGSALYTTGRPLPANGLWSFLAGQTAAGEWQARSQTQLRSPALDRAIDPL